MSIKGDIVSNLNIDIFFKGDVVSVVIFIFWGDVKTGDVVSTLCIVFRRGDVMTGDVVSLWGDVTSTPLGDVMSGDAMSSSRTS